MNSNYPNTSCKCLCHGFENAQKTIRAEVCKMSCKKCTGRIYIDVPKHIPDEQIRTYVREIERRIEHEQAEL